MIKKLIGKICVGMDEWLVSLILNLMIVSSRPTVAQSLSNFSSSES